MKLHFRARHKYADSEGGCTSDLKHALLIIDDANDAEDADAPDFAGDMATASPGGLSHGQTACEPVSRGGELTMKFHAIGDSSPPSWQKLAFVTYYDILKPCYFKHNHSSTHDSGDLR